MHILIFKTNISTLKQLRKIKPLLNSLPNIIRWNIDQEDIDNILRIETEKNISNQIESKLQEEGYYCKELPD
ncbi:hypothetical protein ACG2LH_15830 [Zhouia sp. PK063]|uniref:hypothetical protein n=1 Tax=Zhouia sp. PK063 TaxID=3373602 RepID=UPI003792F1B9